jgi:hypothetical protein
MKWEESLETLRYKKMLSNTKMSGGSHPQALEPKVIKWVWKWDQLFGEYPLFIPFW